MDHLTRGLDASKAIRVVAAVTTDLVREAAQRHGLTGAAAVLLGRGLTAGCLLATLTKIEDERVRIAMKGDGPLGRLLVDAHGDGTVRGCFVSDRVPRMKLPVGPGRAELSAAVGRGQLTVTRDLGLDRPYQGVVELRSGELDEDLERYLSESEQLPSVLRCQVTLDPDGQVRRAGGVLAQTFPGADPSLLDPIREALHGDGLPDVLRHDREAHELAGLALGGAEFLGQPAHPLRFHCGCGPERARSVVSSLGADDIDALADEQGGTDVRCSYCGEEYRLSETDLRELAAELRAQRS